MFKKDKDDDEPLVLPAGDADMDEKVEYAWKVIKRDIKREAEASGKPLGVMEKMMLNAFEDMLPAMFTMAPQQARKYGEKIYALMSYALGYTATPTGE